MLSSAIKPIKRDGAEIHEQRRPDENRHCGKYVADRI